MDDGLLSSPNPILIQNNFAFYWKHLAEWLDDNSNFGFKNVAVILDNCSSHRAKTTADYLKRSNWSIYFLPPYSPQLAPVELAFNHIKSHIKFKDRKALLKLSKVDALSYALKIMKPVTSTSIKGYYWKFLQNVRGFLPIFKTYE